MKMPTAEEVKQMADRFGDGGVFIEEAIALQQFATLLRDPEVAMLLKKRAEASEQPTEAVGKDWTEDFARENGQYFCKCGNCGCQFIGHKRRIICKACSIPQPAQGMVMVSKVELEDAWRQADAGNCLGLSADLRHILDREEK
jgi:hypothetical protein